MKKMLFYLILVFYNMKYNPSTLFNPVLGFALHEEEKESFAQIKFH